MFTHYLSRTQRCLTRSAYPLCRVPRTYPSARGGEHGEGHARIGRAQRHRRMAKRRLPPTALLRRDSRTFIHHRMEAVSKELSHGISLRRCENWSLEENFRGFTRISTTFPVFFRFRTSNFPRNAHKRSCIRVLPAARSQAERVRVKWLFVGVVSAAQSSLTGPSPRKQQTNRRKKDFGERLVVFVTPHIRVFVFLALYPHDKGDSNPPESRLRRNRRF